MRNLIIEKIYAYAQLMRWHRPIGIFLLLWPTWWALWLAGNGHPHPDLLVIFTLGVFIMRSAGCVINDYADRHIDGAVARTRQRPLVTGRVTPKEALGLFFVLILCALLLVLQLNWLTIGLSCIGLLLATGYPFAKRYTYWPQSILALAFSWSIIMVFAAQTNHVPPIAWLLFFANFCWTMAYDTMYAMTDRPDDLMIGVKSTAVLWGKADRLLIGLLQLATLLSLSYMGNLAQLSAGYYSSLIIAAGLAAYQQYLLKDRQPQQCFQAFLNNNWFGATIFIGLLWHFSWV